MLTLAGRPYSNASFCDGHSRRNFLKIGTLGLAGLALPDLLRAEASAGASGSRKSVIMIYLVGGPPHQDMFDVKPEAPAEIAGPWRPIPTNVPGFEICEAFPRLASIADKLVAIRSLVGNQANHDAIQVFNGHHPKLPTPTGGWPQFGSTVARLHGSAASQTPPFVSLCYTCTHGPYNEPGPGFLGASYTPFRPMGPTRDDLVLQGVTLERLADRRGLLRSFDDFRRDADASGMMRADYAQALLRFTTC
jgi:prepilin-type processing-associated H-X9-DG protein